MRRLSLFRSDKDVDSPQHIHNVDDEILNQVPPGAETLPDAEDPPDGGYGWICVFAVALINGFSWGVAAVGHVGAR